MLPLQEEPEEEEAPQPAARAKGGKKKKSKRELSFADLEDEEPAADSAGATHVALIPHVHVSDVLSSC
jgi:hypothetical protein